MSNPEWEALGLSIIAAGVGMAFALTLHDGMSFSRSGAAICVVAVFFAYKKIPDRLVKELPGFLDENLSAKKIAAAVPPGLTITEAQAKQVEAEVRNDVGVGADETIKRLLRLEAALLVAGTIIWGFGDMPFNHFWPASTCSCPQALPPAQPPRSDNGR